jgi:iron complex transport system ATP-binding protein
MSSAEPGFVLENAGLHYGPVEILSAVTLRFDQPEMIAIAGPNGAGKSTLLSIMAGLRSSYVGSCRYQSQEVREWRRRLFCRKVSFVQQSLRLDFPFTAEQVVLMGRTPYAGGLFETAADWEAVERSMTLTDTLAFKRRDFRSLSGGERQRVVLASALAQQPEVLLLDEPTTFLDLEHQVSIYRLLRGLTASGILVITVTHDVNLALAFADRVVALKKGAIVADGKPAEALSPERIEQIFAVTVELLPREGGRHWIAYGG